jgi:alpha-methylacyl-CoA racemase
VRARNPRIVYASLTGYGSDGSMRDVAGHDINYIAYAGVLGMTGPPGGPVCPPGVQVGDLGGATMLAIGLLAALYKAERTGEGSRVEVSLYDAALAWTSIHAGELWASGHVPNPGEMLLNGRFPCYGVYRCADGGFISVGAIEPKFWAEFCRGLGRDDLLDSRLDPAARDTVAAAVATRTRDEWASVFQNTDACVAPVLDLAEALAHPLARERHMVLDAPHPDLGTAPTLGTPIRIDSTPCGAGRPPSALGEDTVDLLREAGLDAAEVDALLSAGVVRDSRPPT